MAKKIVNKKYNPIEPQVSKWTYIAIAGIFVLILGLVIGLQPSNSKKVYDAYKNFASADFTEDHPFVEVSYRNKLFSSGLEKIIDQDEIVILYVGYNQCQSCIAHIGAFQKYFYSVGLSDKVDQIYYFNALANQKDFAALQTNLEGITGETPQLLVYLNGKLEMVFTVQSADNTQVINNSVKTFFEQVLAKINAI